MSLEQAVVQLEQTNAALQEEVVRFRDAAMGLNTIYPTITEGRQAVADGQYFSVPGGGAYMRLYRRQGSSAELIAEFPDRAELNSVIAQLGPLLGRGVTGGPGDLMSKGAFGLGADTSYNAPHLGDITQDFESGFYRMPMSAVGAPAGDANFWASLMFTSGQGGRRYALAHEFLGSMGSKLHVGVRGNGTGEMIWQYALLNTHMVGTVSQSDGVPTGAIIERGSNANGEYTKFADGTLLMWMPVNFSTSSSSVGTGESISINYPVPILSNSSTVLLATLDTASGAWSIAEERWKFDFGARTNTAYYCNLQTRRKEAGSPCTGKFLFFVSARWAS